MNIKRLILILSIILSMIVLISYNIYFTYINNSNNCDYRLNSCIIDKSEILNVILVGISDSMLYNTLFIATVVVLLLTIYAACCV